MDSAPIFSVLIPTRNRPALLARALDSVRVQQGPEWEAIVADDGDGAGEATAQAIGDARVAAFRTGECGQVPARNQAVARARGRFVAFLDDDDWWATTDHLARMAAALRTGAALAYADGRIVREDEGGSEIPFRAAMDAVSIRRDNLLLVSGIAYPRRLHARIGPFDETYPVYWDWDFYLRVAASGASFAHSGGDGVRISARGGTASSAMHREARRAELGRLCAKHGMRDIALRNHESIALDQADGGRVTGRTAAEPERTPC